MKKICLNLVLAAVSISATAASAGVTSFGVFHGQTLKGLSNVIKEANQTLRTREQAANDVVRERMRFLESLKFRVESRIVNASDKMTLAEQPSERAIACAQKQSEKVYEAMLTVPGVLDKSIEANLQNIQVYAFEVLNPVLKGSPLPAEFSVGEALTFKDGTSHLLLPVGVKANGTCVLQDAQDVAKVLMRLHAPEPESSPNGGNVPQTSYAGH